MICNFLTSPQLAYFPVNEDTFFQQDRGTSRTARISLNAVSFYKMRISRGTSHSTDLSAMIFFLWRFFKSKVFEVNPPSTIQVFKQCIRDEIEAISINMLREVMQNFQFRLQECIYFNGGYLAYIINVM